MKRSRMAEREGFEPSIRFYPYTTLAVWCFRPLSHLSRCQSSIRSAGERRKGFSSVFGQESLIDAIGRHDLQCVAVQRIGFLQQVEHELADEDAAHAVVAAFRVFEEHFVD